MKLLELGVGTEPPFGLHPRITVLSGIDDHLRRRLVDAVAALASGGHPDVRGRLEVHGLRFPLDPATAELLNLPADVESVLGRAREARPADRSDRRLAAAASVADARAALTRASQVRTELEIALRAARDEHAAALSSLAAAAPATQPAAVLPVEDTELQRARGARDEAAFELVAASAMTQDEQVTALEAWLADAPELPAEVASIVAEAEQRLADAQQRFAEAEHRFSDPLASPADLAELEAAHVDVEEAERKGPRAGRELELAEARERKVLDRLGLSSYWEYRLRTSVAHVEAGHGDELGRARSELIRAKAAWEALSTEREAMERRQELVDELARARNDGPDRARAAAQWKLEQADRLVADLERRAETPVIEARAEQTAQAEHKAQTARGLARRVALLEQERVKAASAEQQRVAELAVREAEQAVADGAGRGWGPRPGEEAARCRREGNIEIDLTAAAPTTLPVPDAADLEARVMAHLLAQRRVSFAGSLPLLVDDAFAGLAEEDRDRLLALLDRTADTVQVIYLSDDPAVLRWAASLGTRRAATIVADRAERVTVG